MNSTDTPTFEAACAAVGGRVHHVLVEHVHGRARCNIPHMQLMADTYGPVWWDNDVLLAAAKKWVRDGLAEWSDDTDTARWMVTARGRALYSWVWNGVHPEDCR